MVFFCPNHALETERDTVICCPPKCTDNLRKSIWNRMSGIMMNAIGLSTILSSWHLAVGHSRNEYFAANFAHMLHLTVTALIAGDVGWTAVTIAIF